MEPYIEQQKAESERQARADRRTKEQHLEQLRERLMGYGIPRLFDAMMTRPDGSRVRNMSTRDLIFRDVYTMAEKLYDLGYRQVLRTATPPPED